MREKELQFFRSQLVGKLHTLESQHRSGEIPTVEGNSDTIDRANGELEKDLFFQIHERESRAIREIYQALGRIEEGTFGICAECGERISHRRLWANPSATLCVECQEMREEEEMTRHGRGPSLSVGASNLFPHEERG